MKKWILLAITCMLLVIMTACSEPRASSELHINSDGTGTRSITTYLWKNDNLHDGNGSSYYYLKKHGNELATYLRNMYTEKVSGSDTWLRISVDDTNPEYETITLSFDFNSIDQYMERLRSLIFERIYNRKWRAPSVSFEDGTITGYQESPLVTMLIGFSARNYILNDESIFDINCTKNGLALNTQISSKDEFKTAPDLLYKTNTISGEILDGIGMRIFVDGGSENPIIVTDRNLIWPQDFDETSLINNTVAENNIANSLAIVQSIAGQNATTVLSGANKPGVALVPVAELTDVAEFLALCMEQCVIPTLQVGSVAEANLVLAAMDTSGCTDVTVVSESAEALSHVRAAKNIIRTGLIVNLTKAELTSEEANEIRMQVRNAPATFCIIKSDNASKQAVAELQELAVAVWVEVSAESDSEAFTVEAMKALTSGANGVIADNAAKVTEIINTYMEKGTMTKTPLIVGHRGSPNQAMENTISGFLTAYENGADILEIDLAFTLDGEVIVMHDATITRTTNYTGTSKVSQMTLAEIKQYFLLDLDGNITAEKVPTLAETFEALADIDARFFIELKDRGEGNLAANAAKVVAIIQEYGMEDRVNFISSSAYLEATLDSLPGISTGLLRSLGDDDSSAVKQLALANFEALIGAAQNVNSTINTNKQITMPLFTQAATERGMTIWPYTYDSTSNNYGFFNGSDGITTNDPQWAKNMSKYIEAAVAEVTVEEGKTTAVTVNSVTYGRETNAIRTSDLIVKVLSGTENVTVNNGKIVGSKEGTAVVMFGYKTETLSGSPYVLYTQPIVVTVTEGDGTVTPGDNTGDNTGNTGDNAGNTGDNTGNAGNNTGTQSPETGDNTAYIWVLCCILICGCLVVGKISYKVR